jgi:hypothetical protein
MSNVGRKRFFIDEDASVRALPPSRRDSEESLESRWSAGGMMMGGDSSRVEVDLEGWRVRKESTRTVRTGGRDFEEGGIKKEAVESQNEKGKGKEREVSEDPEGSFSHSSSFT